MELHHLTKQKPDTQTDGADTQTDGAGTKKERAAGPSLFSLQLLGLQASVRVAASDFATRIVALVGVELWAAEPFNVGWQRTRGDADFLWVFWVSWGDVANPDLGVVAVAASCIDIVHSHFIDAGGCAGCIGDGHGVDGGGSWADVDRRRSCAIGPLIGQCTRQARDVSRDVGAACDTSIKGAARSQDRGLDFQAT